MSEIYFTPIDKCWICGISTKNKTDEELDVLPFWCSEEHEKQWRKKVTPPNWEDIPDEEWYDKNENGKVYNMDEEEEEANNSESKCPHERNCKAHREICIAKFGHSEITQRK